MGHSEITFIPSEKTFVVPLPVAIAKKCTNDNGDRIAIELHTCAAQVTS